MSGYSPATREAVEKYLREGTLRNIEISKLCGVSCSFVERTKARLGLTRGRNGNGIGSTRASIEQELFATPATPEQSQKPRPTASRYPSPNAPKTPKPMVMDIGTAYRFKSGGVKPVDGEGVLISINKNKMHIFKTIPAGWIITFTPAQMVDMKFEIIPNASVKEIDYI